MLKVQNDQVKLNKLQAEYHQLKEQFDGIEASARELADRYARTNLDDASVDHQRAFRCFQRGQLDSALLIFKTINLEAKASDIVSEQTRNAALSAEFSDRNSKNGRRKNETIEALLFKASLHKTKFEVEKTRNCYQLLVRLDSTNTDILWSYGNFLNTQKEYMDAINLYQKAISSTDIVSTLIAIQSNVGSIYMEMNEYSKAESVLKET